MGPSPLPAPWALFPHLSRQGHGGRAPGLLRHPGNVPDEAAGLGAGRPCLGLKPEPGVWVEDAGPWGLPAAGSREWPLLGCGDRGGLCSWGWAVRGLCESGASPRPPHTRLLAQTPPGPSLPSRVWGWGDASGTLTPAAPPWTASPWKTSPTGCQCQGLGDPEDGRLCFQLRGLGNGDPWLFLQFSPMQAGLGSFRACHLPTDGPAGFAGPTVAYWTPPGKRADPLNDRLGRGDATDGHVGAPTLKECTEGAGGGAGVTCQDDRNQGRCAGEAEGAEWL